MTIAMELDPSVEKLAKAKTKGMTLEDYLPKLVTQAVQEDAWEEQSASNLTMMGAEPVLRRLWDTPEEDEAWRDL